MQECCTIRHRFGAVTIQMHWTACGFNMEHPLAIPSQRSVHMCLPFPITRPAASPRCIPARSWRGLDTIGAWEFVSEDGCEALINAVTLEVHGNMNVTYVRPKGLISGALYQDQDSKAIYPADALMHAGLPVPTEFGEYNAYQWHLKMMK